MRAKTIDFVRKDIKKTLNVGKNRTRELDWNNMRDFRDVKVGDPIQDYAGEKGKVIAKGIGLEDFNNYGKQYDDSGAMAEFWDYETEDSPEEFNIQWIAVRDDYDENAVFLYDYSGAYVPDYLN